ncbi:MAG TPA: GNAT family N-acetyltransferase [Stellaceae bacterium]|nr:GNAT family N-acetyltransferase [Stellaceae bacterium]
MAPSDPRAALPEGVRLKRLGEDDIGDALALSAEAGWNQLAADWRIFLELGDAYGLTLAGECGRLIASAAILPHGDRFGWISMVLVTAAEQRRGLARWLLRHSMAALDARRLVPLLDATPAGRAVYLGLGFEDCWSLRRLVLRQPPRAGSEATAEGVLVRPLKADDWPAVIAYDGAAFGAERGALLRRLAERLPPAALIAECGGKFMGLLLGRDGRVMSQLGPLVAENDAVAGALLRRAILAVGAPLAIDVADRHWRLGEWLRALGFTSERPLTRMIWGQGAAFDDAARLFAIAGPELG